MKQLGSSGVAYLPGSALLQGTYASLGLARTSEQWRNYGIAAGAALLLTSGYWMYRRLGDVRVRHRQVRCLSSRAQ